MLMVYSWYPLIQDIVRRLDEDQRLFGANSDGLLDLLILQSRNTYSRQILYSSRKSCIQSSSALTILCFNRRVSSTLDLL